MALSGRVLPANGGDPTADAALDQTLLGSHEQKLDALHAERLKLKAGKSTLFSVIQLAADLRDVELQISHRPIEKIATLNRYASTLREMQDLAVTPLDRTMVAKCRETADSDMARARREAAQVDQVNALQRRRLREMAEKNRRPPAGPLDEGSPLIHPTLPPKLAP
jgi:hypothetical protein